MTVGDIRKAIKGLPSHAPVTICEKGDHIAEYWVRVQRIAPDGNGGIEIVLYGTWSESDWDGDDPEEGDAQ